MGFDRLKDILELARRKHPQFSQRMDEAKALARWEEAVGPQIAKHSRAVSVKNGVLWVEVDHPIWRSELHHRKAQILEMLNRLPVEPTEEVPEEKIGDEPPRRGQKKKSKALLPTAPKSPTETPPIFTDIWWVDPRSPNASAGPGKARFPKKP
ncbi:MAG: DUF721 domain-containing protein [Bacteriovoracia bacterium]